MILGYAAPASLVETLALLAKRGADCSILAGGMSLVLALKQGRLARKLIVNIKGISDFQARALQVSDDRLAVGALVSHREIEKSPLVAQYFPALRSLEETLASVQIRNHGTLTGNLCAAEPWSDPPCLLAALDAQLTVVATRGERQVSAADWILGDGVTQREPDELLLRAELPLPRGRDGIGYVRVAPRQGLARPLACAAARVVLSENETVAAARLFIGAVGARPQRIVEAEAMLNGNRPSAELLADVEHMVASAVDDFPDQRCSTSYKLEVAGVLMRRAIANAIKNTKAMAH
jgi:CO/xanthine dehydrogenase FAD-binding subunit